jgi:CubicO group peptidase (beta-lactamase class C family)
VVSEREPTGAFDTVVQAIQTAIVESGIPSVAVAVARDGEIVWERGFGWADRETRLRSSEHVMYSLASITKPMTTTALMILRDRGLIDLNRPINDYLGDAPLTARIGDASDATVLRVANHTSGLGLHYQFFYEDEPYCRPPVAETIRRYGHLVTAPGERWQYSNLGYGVLDHLVAKLSGKSYADFMREDVFIPLGMTRASVDIGPGLEPYVAQRYGTDGVAFPFYDFDHPGGSAVYCSAHDLARFGMFHLKAHLSDQRAVLPDSTIDEMQVATAVTKDGRGYGIGWMAHESDGVRFVEHTGGMGGVQTILRLVPEESIAIALLTNSSREMTPDRGRLVEDILSVVLPDYAEAVAERRAKPEKELEKPAFEPPADLIGEWRGTLHTWLREDPLALRCDASGTIRAQVGDGLHSLVNDPEFDDGWLTGRMLGDIDLPYVSRRRHNLHLDLRLRGDVLSGAIIAQALPTALGAPHGRVGNALSQWAELRKV